MVESRIYSVVVFFGGHECFYGTFSNRKNMFDSIKKNIDLTGTYIKGSRKNLDVTPVTIANGFVNNGLTIYKKNEDDEDAPRLPKLYFKLDKSFTFETAEGVEGELGNGEELEVFRFFPDGGASGSHKLLLKLKGMQKVFHISKLTGRVLIDEDLPN